MTRLQIKDLIRGLINDNQTGEISSTDVREALMAVYDTGILNAGGNGGVMLPIDSFDVNGLDGALLAINNSLAALNLKTTDMSYDNLNKIMSLAAELYVQDVHIQKVDPTLTLIGDDGSTKTSVLFETLDTSNNVTSQAEVGWAKGNTEEYTFLAHFAGNVLSNEVRLEKDGMVILPLAPPLPTDDKQVVTFEMYRGLAGENEVIADVTGVISIAECIAAMNAGGYDFATDIKFKLIATDGSSITNITYKANGDTDETGSQYKFYCVQSHLFSTATAGGAMTGAEIKAVYELETNAFTDVLKTEYDSCVLDVASVVQQLTLNTSELEYFENIMPTYATRAFVESVVINTYYGAVPPATNLGKNDDKYRQYPTEVVTELYNGKSNEEYNSIDFLLIHNANNPILQASYILPTERKIEFYLDGAVGDDITLTVDGTNIPLTIVDSFSVMQVYTFDASMDSIIAGITTNSDIVINSKVLAGEYKDFVKFEDRWIEWQHFSRPTVVYTISATPTKAELIEAFKLINNHDWEHDHDFYIEDTLQTYLILIKYRANGDTDETGTAYKFWVEPLILAI